MSLIISFVYLFIFFFSLLFLHQQIKLGLERASRNRLGHDFLEFGVRSSVGNVVQSNQSQECSTFHDQQALSGLGFGNGALHFLLQFNKNGIQKRVPFLTEKIRKKKRKKKKRKEKKLSQLVSSDLSHSSQNLE